MPDADALPFAIACEPPFLIARLPGVCETLGWTMTHPGFSRASTVAWLEVRNADLTPDLDPHALLRDKLDAKGLGDAVGFMTSRHIEKHHVAQWRADDVVAACLATVGLSNGESVGVRRRAGAHVGTINTLVHVSRPLTPGGFIEAITIIAEARTAALLDTSDLRPGPRMTGTGTDCIVLAAPVGDKREAWAGLHTAVGEAIGGAVYRAIREGAEVWSAEMAHTLAPA